MFSVIICTHNPDWAKLNRVIDSLMAQDFPENLWEWIIVDNASTVPVKNKLPEYVTQRINVVEEKEPGLTPARIAGIRSAKQPWLILIDDDNIVAPSYLSQAANLIEKHPTLGAFGCRLNPEYETTPPPCLLPHVFMLAIRQPEVDVIGKNYQWDCTPFGAGMVVRKIVAEQYIALLETDPMRKGLDRRGNSLMSSGDVDLAYTAIDLGFEIGVFKSLQITHIIPAFRLTQAYMINMMQYNALSNHLLFYIRFNRIPSIPTWKKRIKQYARLLKRGDWFEIRMLHAQEKGRRDALARIRQMAFKHGLN
ncbi:MAG: glycosyltransferase family 2 protein [Chitinophagaceae bacterium]|nr:glycosyltransferase family 2 protein [Chitinophagaceae bacterium]